MDRLERIKKLREKYKPKVLPDPIPGSDGIDGLPGEKGLPGLPGIDGKDGLPGIQGKQGLRGRDGEKGAKGERGLVWRALWEKRVHYFVDDGVMSFGSAYICIQEHTSSKDTQPQVGSVWKRYWAILAEKGDTGPGGVGSPGIQGMPGIDGNSSIYITEGANGITYFRMESPDDNSLWDLHIDSAGAWVSVAVTPVSAFVGANAALSLLGP